MSFAAFIVCGALCMAYFIVFKAYHSSLVKMNSLQQIFNNPNARVAQGEQGKRVLKKLGVSQEPKKAAKKTKKATQVDQLESVKEMLAAKLQENLLAPTE